MGKAADHSWVVISTSPVSPLDQAILLPESGWGALIAWLAGPMWAHAVSHPVVWSLVTVVVTTSDGRTTETQEDRTAR